MVSSDYYEPAWEPPQPPSDDPNQKQLDAAIGVISDANASVDAKKEAWKVIEAFKLEISLDIFPFFYNVYTENTASPLDPAAKQEAEALYQQVKDKITPEHCQRINSKWLDSLMDPDSSLSAKLHEQLEIAFENEDLGFMDGELLLIGLGSLDNLLCIGNTNIGFDLMTTKRYDFNREDAESTLAEAMGHFDQEGCEHWQAGIVTLGDWCDFPAIYRSGGLYELPEPCVIHKNIGRSSVDVISLETLKTLARA